MPRPSRKLLLLLLPVLGAATALAVPPVPKVPPPPRVPVPPPPARVVPHAPAPLPAPPVLPRVERVVPPPPGPHAGRRVPPPVLVPPAGAPGLQVFGYRHPPREHGDREGYRWIPGRNGHEGRWAPHRRPGQHHVWVPGHWRGDLWINGRWARPHRR